MIGEYRVAALCVSEIQNEDIQSLIYPLYQTLLANGWKCIIYNSTTDLFRDTAFDRGEAGVFHLINYDYVDATILFTQGLKNQAIVTDIVASAKKHKKPIFAVDTGHIEGCINVNFDEADAFRDLMTHLMEQHHFTKFACIAGFEGNPDSENRVRIFREALASHEIPFSENRFGYGNFYSVPTREVMQRFLADPEGLPEAIVCINDSMAIAVCEILAEHHIRVPEDVVVTGFDGIVQEKYNFPHITTCRRDMNRFAEFLRDLLEQSQSDVPMQEQYLFPYTLDVSESCGCKICEYGSVSSAINSIYSRMNNTQQYDRSMNNMFTKMTFEQDLQEIGKILKYYLRSDTYICVNSDFFEDHPNRHTYESNPFTETMISIRFFYGEESVQPKRFAYADFLPEWKYLLEKPDPVVVFPLHNQQYLYGYLVTFANDFNYAVQRMQRFVMNLDSCVSMYVQQNSLRRYNRRLREIQNKIIVSFADLVESRDGFTGQHVKRTSEYLRILVKHLAQRPEYAGILTQEVQDLMCKAAPLHDIGKINISDTVLNKPGRLTDEEFEIIKTHTTEGGKIIRQTLTNIEGEDYLRMAEDMAVYHHEKWNGSGYPSHLAGEDIPFCARVMAVVDVFDALTSRRVYKDAFPIEKALNIMEESSGSHFDPTIVSVFLSIREEVESILNSNQDNGVH